MRERDRRIDCAGAGVIGAAGADPADPGGTRELDGEVRGMGHHDVAHAPAAVDERGGGAALDHADGGPRIDRPALELAHIAREAEDAVGIRSGEIGFQHRAGHGRGIALVKAAGEEGVGEECAQRGGGNAPGVFDFGLGQHEIARTMSLY